jgi:hypothetical protein
MRWTLAFGYHEDRTPTHGYEATKPVILPPGHATLATRPSATGAARRWSTLRKRSGLANEILLDLLPDCA